MPGLKRQFVSRWLKRRPSVQTACRGGAAGQGGPEEPARTVRPPAVLWPRSP